MRRRALALAIGAALAVTSCEQTKSVINEATGTFEGTRGEVALAIDQGFARPEVVLDDADLVLAAVADEGATVSAYLLDGQSVSAAVPIEFSTEADGGNAYPDGSNSAAHQREAEEFVEAASTDVRAAFDNLPPADPGADLVGGVQRGITAVSAGEDDEPRIVVVVTGGGVHRNDRLDLIGLSPEDVGSAAVAAADTVGDPTGIVVVIAGVARFTDVEESVDGDFVAVLNEFWLAFCDELEARGAVSCEAGPSVPRDLFRLAAES